MLRDAGLWPVTEPPVFNQFGGVVPAGFALSMTSSVAVTNQTATILFTLDGSDPRLLGGARNHAAHTYTGPVALGQVLPVAARAQNDVTGEWSPLTMATFAPGLMPASSDNLVVAELMYHPPACTGAEALVGYANADDFEFVRLVNIASSPVDLGAVSFTAGITFNFADSRLRFLNPGRRVLLVKDLAAFQARYGHGCDATIAGEFEGNLSNDGERLRILSTNNFVLRDFSYDDRAPWPEAADGEGPSLVLRDIVTNPDPSVPSNWRASAVPGGIPGGPGPQSIEAWRSLFWGPTAATNDSVSGPIADPDGDGLANLAEYGFGLNPNEPSPAPKLQAKAVLVNGEHRLALIVRLAPGARDVRWTWKRAPTLSNGPSSRANSSCMRLVIGTMARSPSPIWLRRLLRCSLPGLYGLLLPPTKPERAAGRRMK
jgi:hypothetical protein